jgi:hypothetical protein
MITYEPIQRIDTTLFLLAFSSDQPTPVSFRVYREGTEIQTFDSDTGSGSVNLSIGSGESPFVEVLDSDCQNPSIAFPGKLTLNWLAVSGSSSYLVQEFVSSVWKTRQTIVDDGSGVFTWLSGWLTDVANHDFRIVPVDAFGNQGTPLEFAAVMVRHPDSPAPKVAYSNSTHKFTLS